MADRSPLALVLEQLEGGRTLRADIAARTGLSPDLVDAAVEHLLRSGRVVTTSLASGCPDSACGGCTAPTGTGCSTASTRTPGPVLVSLSLGPGGELPVAR